MRQLLAVTVSLLTGCFLSTPDTGPPVTGQCDPQDTNPDVDVSFSIDILTIFTSELDPGCSCHQPTSSRQPGLEITGLSLASYDSLLQGGVNSGGQIVIPGDPCSSIVFQKVGDAPPFGSRMPINGPPYLSDAQLDLLHDWIAEGALDN